MKSIIPTVIMIIGITIIALVSACVLSFQMQTIAAKNFETNAISRIEASYYNESVINDLESKASDCGYTLSVKDVSVYGDRKQMLVKLDYSTSLLLLDVSKSGSLEGFAE